MPTAAPRGAAKHAGPGKYEGRDVEIAGTTYVVPALGLRALRTLAPAIERLTAAERNFADLVDPVVDVVHAAVARNYPDLPRETIEDALDVKNFGPIVQAVLEESGFAPAPATPAGADAGPVGNGGPLSGISPGS